nr:hypothetical protein CFP56_65366 [Quercus suber]
MTIQTTPVTTAAVTPTWETRANQKRWWTIALDKLEMEVASSLRQEHNVPIPAELVIIPNVDIQAIINDESPAQGVEGAGPTVTLGGEEITFVALSSTE